MKKVLLILFALFFFCTVNGQGKSKRYSFAKAYFGADLVYTPSYGSSQFLNSFGLLESFDRAASLTPAINVGATHFWGYADIYISINTSQIKLAKEAVSTFSSGGVYTGFRVYPWQLTDKKLRPYIGYKFSPHYYEQESASLTKVKSVMDIGIGYRLPSAYVYLGYNQVFGTEMDFPVSRNQFISTKIPRHFVNFGINWMIETTHSTQDDRFKHLNDFFGNSNKNGLYFGIGPSSAFPIVRSSYIQEELPFLDDLAMPAIFVDISAGYHFSKQDFSVGLAYRPIKQFRSGFGFRQSVERRSLALEGFKFLGDYHGFAPFIGAGLSIDRLHLRESDSEILIRDEKQQHISPLLVFGWDIRPGIKSDPWLLRTNLRYAPILNFETGSGNLSLQHLEFNFIQFVVYPGRIIGRSSR
jgi:hypothetical protein